MPMEIAIKGVSTRKVRRITEELCGTSFSESTVSKLWQALDLMVRDSNERPLEKTTYLSVNVEALQLKVRKNGRVVPQSAMAAVGVNAAGYREILGLMIGDGESEASWSEFFIGLKQWGLRGVYLVLSYHRGLLVNAVHRHFQGVAWKGCKDHLM